MWFGDVLFDLVSGGENVSSLNAFGQLVDEGWLVAGYISGYYSNETR